MHSTGTGPAYATVSVYVQGTSHKPNLFTDVGLTIPLSNPFACVAGAYDFYTAENVYVVFGVETAIYEESESLSFREYQGPYNFPP